MGVFVLLCLLASTAWAQTATKLKCNKCVGTSDIAKGAVTGSRIKNGAVTETKLKDGAVKSAKIKNYSVTSSKISSSAVTSVKIEDGTIKLWDLGDDVLEVINPELDSASVTVDCVAGDTIQAAVDAARPGVHHHHHPGHRSALSMWSSPRTTSSSPAIRATVAHKVVPGTSTGGITITGADRVVIDNLTVSDNTVGSAPIGIKVTAGSSATITDSVLSGHVATGAVSGDDAGAGIIVARNAYVTMDNISVTNPVGGANALMLIDGATVTCRNSTFISNDGAAWRGAAIGIYRSSDISLDGNNTVTNTVNSGNAQEALAIHLSDTANLRMKNGGNIVDGNVNIIGNSGAKFLGTTFTGEMSVERNSYAGFFQSSAVTGNIDIQGSSMVKAESLSVTGAVSCSSLSGIDSVTFSATGGTGTCNTPHLKVRPPSRRTLRRVHLIR